MLYLCRTFVDMKIGSKIKDLRIRRGYTQLDLSELTDLSKRTIQRIENDEVEPSLYSLKKLSEILKIDLLQIKNKKQMENSTNKSLFWLIFLHFSGLFLTLFPPLIIWMLFRKKDEIIDVHGKDVINFQLNMISIAICCGTLFYFFLPYMAYIVPMLFIIGTFNFITAIVNVIRVSTHKEFNYPIILRFIR